MMLLNIILGIIGLGLVVFVHETGHFVAAKLSGIDVEAFSIGMGKKLISYTWKNTEYRISLLPFGGYCKLKGEEQFVKAIENKENTIPYEKGSIFSVSAGKKIITYLAGPAFNLIFAVLVLCIIWFAGFSYQSWENRIIVLSDYASIPGFGSTEKSPAESAGILSGDRIITINGKNIKSYRDIQETISPAGGNELSVSIDRSGVIHDLLLTPSINKDTGTGRIGISAWIEPVIGEVTQNSAAFISGLEADDILLEIDGTIINHHIDFYAVMSQKPGKIEIKFKRGEEIKNTVLICEYNEDGEPDLGLSFKPILFSSEKMGLGSAFIKGTQETLETLALTLKSIGLLFSGIKLNAVLSGPVRITYYIGQVTTSGFASGIGSGFSTLFHFLSLLSIALAFGNLLPIPALDGGRTLLSVYELIKKKPVSPRFFYRYQIIGFAFIAALIVVITFSDIFYLINN